MYRPPPFSGLTAFYAAARTGSLTAAARDLNVSQPAITRRIAQLEADLGCTLFDRATKPVRMTDDGRELMAALSAGFGQIEAATERLRLRGATNTVTVSGTSGFVAYWLIPRLGLLSEEHPELNVRIITQENNDTARPGEIDIRFATRDAVVAASGTAPRKIIGETVIAAASPLYLERYGRPGGAAGLSGHVLLSLETRARWYDWPSWFRALGLPPAVPRRQVAFNDYAMVVNAMLTGQGVGLLWAGLLDSFLEAGALERIGTDSASSDRGYFLTLRDGNAASKGARTVADWIARQCGAD